MTKRAHGEGTIDPSGEGSWRLRYRIDGQRYQKTYSGTLTDARKALRALLRTGDTGTHVAPDMITVKEWIERWIATGASGRRRKKCNERTLERYAELLRCHVVPNLGARPLQDLRADEIDALYVKLEPQMSPRTAHHTHSVFGAALSTAHRKGLIAVNPMDRVEKIPSPGEADHGMTLDENQLLTVVEGFKNSVHFAFVATAAFTGARRNEILGLQCDDLDPVNKTLRIERAVEDTKRYGLRLKEPKNVKHKRTIAIDDALVALLQTEIDRIKRIIAGVPDGAAINLGLVKLPKGALIFPRPPEGNESFSPTALRRPRNVTKELARRAAKLGFAGLRPCHDLRSAHETLLLDKGLAVHVVAARCGHDPAVLLRVYAKRTRKADTNAAAVIASLSKGVLG
jgi:integrase